MRGKPHDQEQDVDPSRRAALPGCLGRRLTTRSSRRSGPGVRGSGPSLREHPTLLYGLTISMTRLTVQELISDESGSEMTEHPNQNDERYRHAEEQ
jgi:hypothetical protein